jgi:hypothetical protein
MMFITLTLEMMISGMESLTIPIPEKPAVLHTFTAIYEHYSAAAALFLLFSTCCDKVALGLLIIEVLRSHSVVHTTHCRTPLDK